MEVNHSIEKLIVRYLQKEIRKEELRELDAWIHESEANEAHFFALKSIFDAARQPGAYTKQQAEESWERLLPKLNSRLSDNPKNGKSGKFRLRAKLSWLPYAAAILVAAVIGFGTGKYMEAEHGNPSTVCQEIHIGKNGRANTLWLADGSKITLRSSSRLKYPAQFNGAKREVYLEGEAYFEVAKDASKPFIVHLPNQRITVLGTSFNVQAPGNSDFSVTTLASGRILLEAFDTAGQKIRSVTLEPDHQARADNRSGCILLTRTDASLSKAWIEGKYRFKDEPLLSILRQLENYYEVSIRLTEDSLQNIRYTGTFSLDQEIGEVLEIINSEHQFRITKKGKTIEIAANHK